MEAINKIGRRKSSIARIYMQKGKGNIEINKRAAKDYFPTNIHLYKLNQPFALTDTEGNYDVTVNVSGGEVTGQVEAIRLAIARALVDLDPDFKPKLKSHGLMTRDPRMVERKKPGQKKARKKFQFSKR